MPTESSGASTQVDEAEDDQPPRGSERSFDAGLGPGCMIWFMIVGLGFFIVTILVWMIGHIGAIFT